MYRFKCKPIDHIISLKITHLIIFAGNLQSNMDLQGQDTPDSFNSYYWSPQNMRAIPSNGFYSEYVNVDALSGNTVVVKEKKAGVNEQSSSFAVDNSSSTPYSDAVNALSSNVSSIRLFTFIDMFDEDAILGIEY